MRAAQILWLQPCEKCQRRSSLCEGATRADPRALAIQGAVVMKSSAILAAVAAMAAALAAPAAARAEELPKEYRDSVNKGLEWLAKQQHPDGHWEVPGQGYFITMTGMSGMA